MKFAALVFCTVLLTGCMGNKMSSWEGKHRDDLIQKWGPPSQETAFTKGGASLVYIQTWANRYGANTCRMVFNTDNDGIIKSWSYYGC